MNKNKISVKNFRGFKNLTHFEIRPLTMLVGANNSGKSSFTKLILAFQNNLNKINFDEKGNHNLESFKKILNWNDPINKELVIRTSFPVLGLTNNFCYQVKYVDNCISKIEILEKDENKALVTLESIKSNYYDSDESGDLKFINYDSKIYFDFEYLNELFISDNYNNTIFSDLDLPEAKESYLLFNSVNKEILETEKDLRFKFQKEYFEKGGKGGKPRIKNYYRQIEVSFDIFHKIIMEIIINFEDAFKKKFSSNKETFEPSEFYVFLKKIFTKNNDSNKVRILEGDINYISVNRGSHKRVLSDISDVQIDKIVKDHYNTDIDNEGKRFIEEALNIFDISGKIIIDREANSVSFVNMLITKIDGSIDKINLADLGFGYSQIIPIILEIITQKNKNNKSKSTFIIEEPEANLHPNLQSKFADFLALSLKFFPQTNFIIETHSEYLIRKLQFLTAKLDLKTEDTIIHNFIDDKYVNNKEPKVKQIFIDENGGLSDTFRKGFFDEAFNLKFKLLTLTKEQKN